MQIHINTFAGQGELGHLNQVIIITGENIPVSCTINAWGHNCVATLEEARDYIRENGLTYKSTVFAKI